MDNIIFRYHYKTSLKNRITKLNSKARKDLEAFLKIPSPTNQTNLNSTLEKIKILTQIKQ